MELINQPFNNRNVGDKIIELLETGDFNSFDFVVAFAKNSGVLQLKKTFDEFRANNCVINAYVGIDLNGTSYEALTNLFNSTDTLHIIHFENHQTFHPKLYRFKGNDRIVFIVGSSNITGGGLWTNIESSILIDNNRSNPDVDNLDKAFTDYINQLESLGMSCLPIKAQEQLDDLLDKNYISKELDILLKPRDNSVSKQKLFGMKVNAIRPERSQRTDRVHPTETNRLSADVQSNNLLAFWIESRAMTGGSRNILDLSKKSLLKKGNPTGTVFDMDDARFIRGAVEFFGLDPMDESQRKDITLNFRGVDYRGNTILYPEGEKANGTWRIQIKGIDENGKEITTTFRDLAPGSTPFLVNKILVFSRIDDSYYYLSVYDASRLNDFVNASAILAHNGQTSTAKLMGLIKND